MKIPFALVLGDNEMASNSVNIRRYGEKDTETLPIEDFIKLVKTEIDNKSIRK